MMHIGLENEVGRTKLSFVCVSDLHPHPTSAGFPTHTSLSIPRLVNGLALSHPGTSSYPYSNAPLNAPRRTRSSARLALLILPLLNKHVYPRSCLYSSQRQTSSSTGNLPVASVLHHTAPRRRHFPRSQNRSTWMMNCSGDFDTTYSRRYEVRTVVGYVTVLASHRICLSSGICMMVLLRSFCGIQ
ncbi:hypothetical protein BDN70DRAFT_885611 [Pholiota conissans]|uniref:Uncharacterized protein n=1 Tax=Pholiota conissans TaxID=109636 RepID=A0A9P5YQR0_9AGAR|nr:hypothetical protein BDN70DRAFT_885611 [Pholiota conissans]